MISGLIVKGATFLVINRKTSIKSCKQCNKSKEGARPHIYSVIIGTCIHACISYTAMPILWCMYIVYRRYVY